MKYDVHGFLTTYHKLTSLSEFIVPGPRHISSVVNADTTWISRDSDTWENHEGFKAARDFVKGLKSVNDASERAFQLITDCNEGVT